MMHVNSDSNYPKFCRCRQGLAKEEKRWQKTIWSLNTEHWTLWPPLILQRKYVKPNTLLMKNSWKTLFWSGSHRNVFSWNIKPQSYPPLTILDHRALPLKSREDQTTQLKTKRTLPKWLRGTAFGADTQECNSVTLRLGIAPTDMVAQWSCSDISKKRFGATQNFPNSIASA